MNPDQDPVVARALADLDVPDHGPEFWEKLDRRLERAARAEAAGLRPVGVEPVDVSSESVGKHAARLDDELHEVRGRHEVEPVDRRTTTGELPSVAELRPPAPPSRRHKVWFVVAAAALVVAITGAALLAGGGDPDTNAPADRATGDIDSTTASNGAGTTGATTLATVDSTPTVAPAVSSPETTVTEWLRAVRAGDVEAAAALIGPRSLEYWASQGPEETLEQALRATASGYGAMAEAPDLTVEEIPLGDYDFGEVVLVAVSGTFTTEAGATGSTTFVFPVVTDGGVSVVEPWALSPEAGGRLEFTQPRVREGEPSVMEADAAIELFTPVEGTAWFRLDDGADGVRPDETSPVGNPAAPFARYDPPGDMEEGDHVAIVGFMSADGAVIIGQALRFDVV